MAHRGPDDTGEFWTTDGRVGLGHARLSIIDLSAAGHQPMNDVTGELCIVFNGEIYNFIELRAELSSKGHEFGTRSDTEVILAAYHEWGTDCLDRLNGMFAFALYDSVREQLFLARDRAGEKPLYYSQRNAEIRFASELKGLLADPAFTRIVDAESLSCYLLMGFVPGNRSMLQGVKKLPPAHAMLFDLTTGKSEIWRYWSLPAFEPQHRVDEETLVEELETLLENAVRRQLVADVPVGVMLSGGVDSSLVTALATRARPGVKTFTIRFPGAGKYDETEHARLIAGHFGTEHLELEAEPSTVDLLPMLARQFDEPMNDSSMIPTYLVSNLIRQHCTVALGGDGGDELFGGYGHYSRLLWLERRFGRLPRPLRRAAGGAAAVMLPTGFRGRSWLQALSADFKNGVPLIASYFDNENRRELLPEREEGAASAETIFEASVSAAPDLLGRATRTDFMNYLAEDILVKVDRASMLNSLEMRAPMLDYSVIEFAFGEVPSELKATPGGRKILLKKLAARLLPPSFDQNRKQGFSIPIATWLADGPWLEFFRAVLLDGQQTLFDHHYLEDLFAGQKKGYSNGERLFALLMFELWRLEYRIEI